MSTDSPTMQRQWSFGCVRFGVVRLVFSLLIAALLATPGVSAAFAEASDASGEEEESELLADSLVSESTLSAGGASPPPPADTIPDLVAMHVALPVLLVRINAPAAGPLAERLIPPINAALHSGLGPRGPPALA